jgi:peptidoglycan-associated lipoprotein
VEPGQTTQLTATATDPDKDPLTYAWTAPQGTFATPNAATTRWTAPNQEGNVVATVTVRDAAGATATANATIEVRRAKVILEDVHFDFDRFNLRPDALKILDQTVKTLQSNTSLTVTIEGHTDSIGTMEYNLALGERRANSVYQYLITRGIAASRMRTVTYGEERPIADNNTAEGRAMNRRAHFVVLVIQ